MLHQLLLGLTLTLQPGARVRGAEITVGDVALVRADTPEEAQRARALPLGLTPAPGFARVLSRTQVEQSLAGALRGTRVVLDGAQACRVEALADSVAGEELTRTAREALARVFTGRESTLTPLGSLGDLAVPSARSNRELRVPQERREARAGEWSVPVQVWIDGELYQTVWTRFQVELVESVPVLTRGVRRGEAIPADAFELRQVRLVSAALPLAPEQLVDSLAQRDLALGAQVFENDVQRVRCVRAGDLVQLSIRKGAVVARTTGIAAQDGFRGERVRVTTLDKQRQLVAVVVGRDTVEVDLAGGR
jgi:flagellar basal body P-ring formation protein FlgA